MRVDRGDCREAENIISLAESSFKINLDKTKQKIDIGTYSGNKTYNKSNYIKGYKLIEYKLIVNTLNLLPYTFIQRTENRPK